MVILNYEIEGLVLWGFKYQIRYMSVFKSAFLELKYIKQLCGNFGYPVTCPENCMQVCLYLNVYLECKMFCPFQNSTVHYTKFLLEHLKWF